MNLTFRTRYGTKTDVRTTLVPLGLDDMKIVALGGRNGLLCTLNLSAQADIDLIKAMLYHIFGADIEYVVAFIVTDTTHEINKIMTNLGVERYEIWRAEITRFMFLLILEDGVEQDAVKTAMRRIFANPKFLG